jgi:hypothetical protein
VGNEAAELPFKPFFGIIFRGFFLLAKGRLDVNFGNLLALGQRGGVERRQQWSFGYLSSFALVAQVQVICLLS